MRYFLTARAISITNRRMNTAHPTISMKSRYRSLMASPVYDRERVDAP